MIDPILVCLNTNTNSTISQFNDRNSRKVTKFLYTNPFIFNNKKYETFKFITDENNNAVSLQYVYFDLKSKHTKYINRVLNIDEFEYFTFMI